MEYEKIRQLIEDISNSKLIEIDITFSDGTKINMKKDSKQETIITNKEVTEPTINTERINTEIKKEEKGKIIKSPMVGTFYLKPSPTSNPYVEIGKEVKVGETLCIIEAMKLMNEIESEYSGKITEIIAKDGEAVEYGAPLFRIE